jgi:hypothetical protein
MEQQRPWNARRFHQKGSRLEFAFTGAKVNSVRIGDKNRIYLGDDFATQIDLWVPFKLTQYGQGQLCHPDEPATLEPLLGIIGSSILSATSSDTTPLTLKFDNGSIIEAPADQNGYQWEAWQLKDQHGFHVVCAIGGKLSIWLPSLENR